MTVLFMSGGLLLGILAWIDIRTKKIPFILVGVLAAVMFGMRVFSLKIGIEAGAWLVRLFAGLLPGGISLLCSYITKGKIGVGDGLVLTALGFGLEFRSVMLLWSMALCMAAVLAMLLLVLKKAGKKTELPFVPCLFLGYVLCQIIGT